MPTAASNAINSILLLLICSYQTINFLLSISLKHSSSNKQKVSSGISFSQILISIFRLLQYLYCGACAVGIALIINQKVVI